MKPWWWICLWLVFLGHHTVYRPMAQVANDVGAQTTDTIGNDLAIDNSWDFSSSDLVVGLPAASEGWGNANAMYQLNVVLTVRNGLFSGLIVGLKPNFASPLMQIFATPRHYLVMRMNYVGPNTDAQILIRTGALSSAAETYISAPQSQWEADQTPVGVSSSDATDFLHTVPFSCDGDLHTYYLSNNISSGVELVYDLGAFRWITQVRIIPVGGKSSPKTVLVGRSSPRNNQQSTIPFFAYQHHSFISSTVNTSSSFLLHSHTYTHISLFLCRIFCHLPSWI